MKENGWEKCSSEIYKATEFKLPLLEKISWKTSSIILKWYYSYWQMAVALVHHFCSCKMSLEVPFFLAMFS